jgi:hypothetical protein
MLAQDNYLIPHYSTICKEFEESMLWQSSKPIHQQPVENFEKMNLPEGKSL